MASTRHWCLLRSNRKLRQAIKLRIKERGLTYKQIVNKTDIPINKLSNYLNNKPESTTQAQLLRLAEFLDVDVKLEVKFN